MSNPEPTTPDPAPTTGPVVPPGAVIAGQTPATPAPTTEPPAGTAPQQVSTTPEPDPAPSADDPAAQLARANAEIVKLRKENAKRRDALAQVNRAINPEAEPGQPVDSVQITGQLHAQQRENLVLRSAASNGADANALLDSVSFLASIGQIDPKAEDATGQVAAAITAAIERDPKLRNTPATPTPPAKAGSGAAGGGHTAPPPKTLSEAVAARMGG